MKILTGYLLTGLILLVIWSQTASAQVVLNTIPSLASKERKQDIPRSGQTRQDENPLLDDYDVTFYKLDVEADNRSDYIRGTVTIQASVVTNSLSSLVLELTGSLLVDHIRVNQRKVSFTHEGEELIIPLNPALNAGETVTVQVTYEGQTGEGMVNEKDPEWHVPVTYTLSEPFYAKDWFPCKEVLTDKADSVYVFVTTDYGLTVVSNGLHTGTTYFPDGKVRYEWKSRYPIDFYLICFAIADYQEYTIDTRPAGLDRPITIQNFVYDVPGCLETYRNQILTTIPIMDLYCSLFGPYPFREEKYGQYLWPWGGGMEHQTMTGLGSFEFTLVSHELGHSWFGDFVTCASWQDIWINEGFATYATQLAIEYLAPGYIDENLEYRFERALREPDGSVYIPEDQTDNDARIFNANLSYSKGMALIHMIRFELQDDSLFFKTLRNFLNRYANSVATGMDFKQVLEETSGMDFTDFFNQWYVGAGYPIYAIDWDQQNNLMTLNVTQTTSSALTPLFKMSMEYRVFYPGGDSTIRVYQDANFETYQFTFRHKIDSIVIDPDNWVLNEVAGIKKAHKPEAEQEHYRVYPNPTGGILYFTSGQEEGPVPLTICNTLGQVVGRKLLTAGIPGERRVLSLENFNPGLYWILIGTGPQAETKIILLK